MDLYRLKLELTCHGIQLAEQAEHALPKSKFNQFVHRDYPTTGGLVIELSPDIYANSLIDVRHRSPFTLHWEDGYVVAADHIDPIEVGILPPPRFALDNTKLPSGMLVRSLVMSHADRSRISPIYGCSFNCGFCNAPGVPYQRNSIEDLTAAYDIALSDELLTPRHTLISGGTPESVPADYRYMDEVYQFFPDAYPDMPFDVMLSPRPRHPGDHTARKYLNFLSFLKQCNIQGLSINLELFGQTVRKRYIHEKERIGRDNYLLFIEKAVEIFGPGRIRSCLVVGLESIEDTLAGVRAIAERGAMPVLSPFNPAPGTFLARNKPPTPDFLEDLYYKSKELVSKFGVELGPKCRKCCHNNL